MPIDLRTQSLAAGGHAAGFDAVNLTIDTSGKTVARQAAMDVLGKRGALVCVGHGEGLNEALRAEPRPRPPWSFPISCCRFVPM